MKKHLEDMQAKASNLQYLLGAVRALEGSEYSDERISLEDAAFSMARDLNTGLDIVNLPEEKGVTA